MYLFSKPASLLLTFLFSVTVDIMASRGCINSKDLFCYVCGWLTDKPHRKTFTPLLKKAYEAYFDSKVDSGKGWAPQFICLTCACNLRGWIRKAKKNNHLAFGVPMIWRESSNHTTDCYFCSANVTGFSYKTRASVKYPDVPSVSKPIPHDPVTCPIPTAPTECTVDKETQEESSLSSATNDSDSDYYQPARLDKEGEEEQPSGIRSSQFTSDSICYSRYCHSLQRTAQVLCVCSEIVKSLYPVPANEILEDVNRAVQLGLLLVPGPVRGRKVQHHLSNEYLLQVGSSQSLSRW